MNKKQHGFGGGCAEIGLVASVTVACVVFAIALAVRLHNGLPLSSATLKALAAAAIAFGSIIIFWRVAYAAISILFGNKE